MKKFFKLNGTPGLEVFTVSVSLDAVVAAFITNQQTYDTVVTKEERKKGFWRRLWTGWKEPTYTVETENEVWCKPYKVHVADRLGSPDRHTTIAQSRSLEQVEKALAELLSALEAS